jgi:hypothetical protein
MSKKWKWVIVAVVAVYVWHKWSTRDTSKDQVVLPPLVPIPVG